MDLMVFGTGVFFQNRYSQINENDTITAFIDNDPSKQGGLFMGIPVMSVSDIPDNSEAMILLMADAAPEMKLQLLESGVDEQRILFWGQYRKIKNLARREYIGRFDADESGKVLFVTGDLGYNGASLVGIYAVMALKTQGIQADLAVTYCDPQLLEELKAKDFHIIISPSLQYADADDLDWISSYKAVIVSTAPMIRCASIISKIKPVIWWLHEPAPYYKSMQIEFKEYINPDAIKDILACPVSTVARGFFETLFPDRADAILPCGIPDPSLDGDFSKTVDSKHEVVFAIIGTPSEMKGHDIFIQAALIAAERIDNIAFWIIGAHAAKSLDNRLHEMSKGCKQIVFMGEKTRAEIRELYERIDVVVSPSRMDTIPIVCIEAMAFGKPYIASDKTGISQFTENHKNGLICASEDVSDLAQKMIWLAEHTHERREIGINARQTYVNFFTLNAFGRRLKETISKCINN